MASNAITTTRPATAVSQGQIPMNSPFTRTLTVDANANGGELTTGVTLQRTTSRDTMSLRGEVRLLPDPPGGRLPIFGMSVGYRRAFNERVAVEGGVKAVWMPGMPAPAPCAEVKLGINF